MIAHRTGSPDDFTPCVLHADLAAHDEVVAHSAEGTGELSPCTLQMSVASGDEVIAHGAGDDA